MDISKIDDSLYLKSKKALGSFLNYLMPAFNIVRTQGLSLGSDSEKELLKDYNRENILYTRWIYRTSKRLYWDFPAYLFIWKLG